MAKERDEEFLELVVTSLVDNPDDVKINRTVDEMGVLLTLDIHPDDMGKIIGRSGNTAKAIRTLLRVVGLRNNARINLKINEPEGSTRGPRREESSEATPTESPVVEESASAASDAVDQAMEDLKI
ncbi:MAG: KH domain-containing protein [Candidatus Pacebacteria bacterium]|nr:KH domain-containing protein [Candidatus Paceibacterota bacterium]